MFQPQTQAASYWTTSFRVTDADIEYLFSQFLENETPLSSHELALSLIRHRLTQEEDRLRKQIKRGEIYEPKNAYDVGQKLIFPAFSFAVGKVTAQRPGYNNDYGEFSVIEVEFDNRQRREFASALRVPHALNLDEAGGQYLLNMFNIDPEAIFAEYGESLIEALEARLVEEEDAIFMAGKWFLKSLLAEVNVGHLHLAEAILDLAEGNALPASAILKELDFAQGLPEPLREFSLNVALGRDERFDNVGPAGKVLWFLRRLEPAEVSHTPVRLEYRPEPYDRDLLTDELRQIEIELGDEFSPLEVPESIPGQATITLIYPHRRVGTLPLNAALDRMFPTAEDSARVRVTMIDGLTNEAFAGWVVREGRYVYGMADFYRRHKLPIGAYVTVRRTEDPGQLVIEFDGHRPRTEYIRLAIPNKGRLRFDNFKRSIGAVYDELLILGAEDIDGVDEVWSMLRNRRTGLADVMISLIPELARLNPQNAVHAKTLYSAVNIVRRCPPGPIFATLVARPEFQHVGGPYWRLSDER